jgi:hypothetical protein
MSNKLQYGNYEVLVPLPYINASLHKINVRTIQQFADNSHIPNFQFKRHFGVPYSRFKEGVPQTSNQNAEGTKRKRDQYEDNHLILHKEKDARNDG